MTSDTYHPSSFPGYLLVWPRLHILIQLRKIHQQPWCTWLRYSSQFRVIRWQTLQLRLDLVLTANDLVSNYNFFLSLFPNTFFHAIPRRFSTSSQSVSRWFMVKFNKRIAFKIYVFVQSYGWVGPSYNAWSTATWTTRRWQRWGHTHFNTANTHWIYNGAIFLNEKSYTGAIRRSDTQGNILAEMYPTWVFPRTCVFNAALLV